ncbi:sigma-70 family RNA polymerase sigma factor [Clostridium felsineum]|uniref:RNA polymerase sigma factor n=1 Tax=Clostridium felsineum TaxID=36839 RepID=UPI00098CA7C8|nr:sigma-70 family RNA polymerase sigma factor [Clostridium felsineum]MCR3760956.1 sigma-70 family RNA polymerase sigma factor [Clostridium felsineum]URZ17842.1 ECF RNA polymerase sigma factor SigW [Clostridium felsineum DSM 794]
MDVKILVKKSKKGDISSFMKLLREREEFIYKISFTYTENSYDAEDCISEAAIKAFDKIKQLKDDNKFFSWYTSILINTCRKSLKRRINASTEEELNEIRDVFSYNAIEDKIIIEGLLNKLKKDEREILVLRYLKDYSIQEVADIMDIPLSTAKTRIYRTLNFLRGKSGGVKNEYYYTRKFNGQR